MVPLRHEVMQSQTRVLYRSFRMFALRTLLILNTVIAIDRAAVKNRLVLVDRALSSVKLSFGVNVPICTISTTSQAVCVTKRISVISQSRINTYYKNAKAICASHSCAGDVSYIKNYHVTDVASYEEIDVIATEYNRDKSGAVLRAIITRLSDRIEDIKGAANMTLLARQLAHGARHHKYLCETITDLLDWQGGYRRSDLFTFQPLASSDVTALGMSLAHRLLTIEVASVLALLDNHCNVFDPWYESVLSQFSSMNDTVPASGSTGAYLVKLLDYINHGSSDLPAPEIDEYIVSSDDDDDDEMPTAGPHHPGLVWLIIVPAGLFASLSVIFFLCLLCFLKRKAKSINSVVVITGPPEASVDLEAGQPATETELAVDMSPQSDWCEILRIRL